MPATDRTTKDSETAGETQSHGLAEREVRALTEYATVLDDVGRARGADGLYLVVSASGREYLVDAEERACECEDHRFRGVDCKHVERVAFATGRRPIPIAAAAALDVDPDLGEHVEGRPRYATTDGGVDSADVDDSADGADRGSDDDGPDDGDGPSDDDRHGDADDGTWIVRDRDRDRARTFESRAEAERTLADLEDLGVDVELLAPRSSDDAGSDAGLVSTDGEQTAPDVVVEDDGVVEGKRDDGSRTPALETRSVSEDPLEWLPDAFVDRIDGTPAINRKGFEVLAHFYDVDVETDVQIGPAETEFEYCQVEATATTPAGRRCEALGSAHVDRDDDPTLLLELADTRARKRAISIATGVGTVAVEELKSELERE